MPKILVVDDEEDIREAIAAHLRRHLGADVTTLPDGDAAIRALESGAWDALVQDVQMRGIDGVTVLRHARRLYPQLVALVISKFDDEAKLREIESLGGMYLPKPFSLNTVTELIRRRLAG